MAQSWGLGRASRSGAALAIGLLLAAFGLENSCLAQTAPPAAPLHAMIDENGVDLLSGHLHRALPQVSIGGSGADGLSSQSIVDPTATIPYPGLPNGTYAQSDSYSSYLIFNRDADGDGFVNVSLFGKSEQFEAFPSGLAVAYLDDGSTLVHSGGYLVFTRADGVVAKFPDYTFYPPGYYQHPSTDYHTEAAVEIDLPAGEIITQQNSITVQPPSYVESSLGYALTNNRSASNLVNGGCDANGCSGPTLSSASALSRAPTVNGSGSSTMTFSGPGNETKTYYFAIGPVTGDLRVTSVTDGYGTWSYSYSDAYDQDPNSYPDEKANRVTTLSVTDPMGRVKTIIARVNTGNVISIQDASGTTTFGYDDTYNNIQGLGRLINVTYPEGNQINLELDDRNNVTASHDVPKQDWSWQGENVVHAGYPSSCDATNYKICNKPSWVQDALGHQTDYTYDPQHGGVLTETLPAAANGVRPQTRYTYGSFTAQYVRNGVMQAAAAPVWRLVRTSKCQTQSSCAGTADEVVTTYNYENSGVPNNVRRLSVATTKGDGSPISNDGMTTATTSYTYDFAGNVLTEDGPLPGSSDTTTYKYDQSRWKVGEIGPDPGVSPLHPRATKTTFNNMGQPQNVFTGWVSDASDNSFYNGFQALQRVDHTYDGQDRAIGEFLYGSAGELISASNHSYWADGRPQCDAVRMNMNQPVAYPCGETQDIGYGDDRITIHYFNSSALEWATYHGANGSISKTEYTYFTPNKKAYEIYDGNGNLQWLWFDGHDLVRGVFNSMATSVGSVDWSDYDLTEHDAAGNRTSWRKRDGQTITYQYDSLNRLLHQTTPGNTRDISYSYDNLGRHTQVSSANSTFNLTYDALGHKLSESGPFGTVSSYYDIAGRRTGIGYPDGFGSWATFDATGETTCQGEWGYQASALTCNYYDDLGRLVQLGRGNGSHSWYYYDGGSRLVNWTFNRPDTGGVDVFGFAHNPANQTFAKYISNPAYEFSEGINVDRGYAHDGKNRMTSSGGVAIGYDGRGNLTSAGSTLYGYDIENHLTSISTGAYADYDALGRFLYTVDANGSVIYPVYDGDHVLYELQGGTGAILRRYVWGFGSDEPLVWYEGSIWGNGGNVDRRWLIANEQGSIAAVTNGQGGVMAYNTYDEYGIPGSGNLGRFQYTGQAWLPAFGLYHYKARAYSPTLGRFMQTDPVGYQDDRNLYAYTHDDPVNHSDPTGTLTYFAGTFIGGDSRVEGYEVGGPDESWRARGSPPPANHNGAPNNWLDDALSALFSAARGGVWGAVLSLSGDTPHASRDQIDAINAGIIRESLAGKLGPNSSLPGAYTASYADELGRGFVGPNATSLSGNKGLQSADGLRTYRYPTAKGYNSGGGLVGNLEARQTPSGSYTSNIHIYVWPAPP